MMEKVEVKNTNIKDTSVKEPYIRSSKPTDKELKWEADKDLEMVKGIFKNHENPGETMRFWYRGHKGHEIEKYELRDGVECTVPLCVARHLNKDCWYAVDQYALDPITKLPTTEVGKKIRRCSFYPIGFVDLDDLSEVGVPFVAPRI
jgi:hypothetical protein